MVEVSTSPVVMVTSRVQSRSRCRVAGCPWTPTLATRPPGRIRSAASSKVAGTPTASIARSTPIPSVRAITASTGSVVPLLIVSSAPNSWAWVRRASAMSIAMMRAGVKSRAVMIAERPTGPAPITAMVSPGRTRPFSDADLERGGQDVGQEEHLLVGEVLRELVDRRVGERHAGVLGLHPVDRVAEDPAAAAHADAVVALLAEPAAPAGADAREQHAVALGHGADAASGLDHRADRLVSQHRPRRGLGHIALEDVQVRAADRRGVDLDDDVARGLDLGIGNRVPAALPGAVIDESLHFRPPLDQRWTPCSWPAPRW